ncbi:hypothetical protein TSTA_060320 [Talaromyces stipitatus ATCC 10500]|uniref:Ubiquitin-like protease family profile domain-containing protein n=1 Tax=Talaromyces stipitatus (strain ATCC 10500 / CBS 375.48 / QM 6759 / NRRL 1006) TaxID=441959 RepID=B8LU65_TALSN|nr:uncharacterized protein TSTA_060320 [Talaromyces stipitatus ATCC 10500]EED22537.1 hypothetical protein TSTA_060320 [Talaromyces stipitatus ATCC 10500]
MDSAASSSQIAPSLNQMASSLLDLLEKLQELAKVRETQEIEDVERLPEVECPESLFRDLVHQLCQEAPAVAQAIAVAIQENIPTYESPTPRSNSNSSRRLSSKRKQKPDQAYQPSHPIQPASKKRRITQESQILEKKTEDPIGSMACIDTDGVQLTSRRMSKPDVFPCVSTSGALITDMEIAPETEDSHPETTPISPDGVKEVSPYMPDTDLTKGASFLETVYHVVNVVNQLKNYPSGLPRTVHIQILQTLQTYQETTMESNNDQWSDGSIWKQVLEGGSAANRRYTILNMLEYMGASKWYDSQIDLAQRTGLGHKGAATQVLDRITRHKDLLNRKLITNQLSRGKKLRTKLVKNLGLGILFSPDIWDYTKRSIGQIDLLVKKFQVDAQRMTLLRILGAQVQQLVRHGSTDPEALYNSLKEHDLVSEPEIQKIRESQESEHNALPEGALDTAVDNLINRVANQIFTKQSLEDVDTFSIPGNVKLPGDLFLRFRPGEWLNSWAIMAAMQVADRPPFVKFSECIPVNDIGRHGRMRSIKKPFQIWAKKIAELRREAEHGLEDCRPLTFFSPICKENSHFTLLEINDGEKVIRHYDSLAAPTTINGTKKTSIAALVEDEFGDLEYQYIEAPTPQQSDDWSCGTRVIWNFKQRCNGFDIGSWDTVLDSERMQLDIVNGLMACIDSHAIRKYSRNSKRGVTNELPRCSGVEESSRVQICSASEA